MMGRAGACQIVDVLKSWRIVPQLQESESPGMALDIFRRLDEDS